MRSITLIVLACLLSSCGEKPPSVVVQIQRELPAPPSADLMVQPPPVVTAGSKDVGEVIQRMALGNLQRDRIIAGWIGWWLAAKLSAERANAGEGK